MSRQFRRTVARTPPPAFLFPDQRFQRPREPENRTHRLAPGCGGGGDVVASVFRVKRLFRRRTSFRPPRPETGEALFSASIFRVKWFFLKKNLCLRTGPGSRWRRLSKESQSPCQPGFFSHFAGEEIRGLQAAKNRLESPRGLPLFRYRRFDWSAEPNRNTLRKQPALATFFPGNPGGFRLRGPGGRPVSERGGDIRSGHFVRKPIPTDLRTFSRSLGRWTSSAGPRPFSGQAGTALPARDQPAAI